MDIESTFIDIGGQFITDHSLITRKLSGIKAFIFDWDGVFNNGQKNLDGSSGFSEVDSMGTNLLRFSHFQKNGKMPLTAVISGEKNETAFYFCKRECFDYSFFKTPHKIEALKFICDKENIKPSEVAYFFDDVLDLSIAEVCGLRMMVNRKSNPLLIDYCVKNKLVDYLTASDGGSHAVREASELLVGLYGNFDTTVHNRTHYTETYNAYITKRRLLKPQFFTIKDKVVVAVDASTI